MIEASIDSLRTETEMSDMNSNNGDHVDALTTPQPKPNDRQQATNQPSFVKQPTRSGFAM